jgi:hypothetical protein
VLAGGVDLLKGQRAVRSLADVGERAELEREESLLD